MMTKEYPTTTYPEATNAILRYLRGNGDKNAHQINCEVFFGMASTVTNLGALLQDMVKLEMIRQDEKLNYWFGKEQPDRKELLIRMDNLIKKVVKSHEAELRHYHMNVLNLNESDHEKYEQALTDAQVELAVFVVKYGYLWQEVQP